ncbi:MAG: porin family protein [Planctomycetota bacterium]|jgi:hypothetical protein
MRRSVLILLVAPAFAQNDDLKSELEELRKIVAEQAEQLDAQQKKIGRLESTQRDADIERYLDSVQGVGSDGKETAGYDGRFFVQTKDGQYRLMFRWYSQARYNWNHRDNPPDDEKDDVQGWEVSRTRIWLDGDLTDRFYFHFRINIDSSSNFKLVNAYIRWRAPGGWNVDIGERWFYLSREDWTLPMDQLTTEFSANDLVFAIGTSRGVQVSKAWDTFRFYGGLSDGRFSGGQNFTQATSDFTLTGRFEYQWLTTDWSIWDDLTGRRGRPKGVMLGFGIGYANGKNGTPGPRLSYSILLTLDLNINWDGGQAMIYGTWRFAEPDEGEGFYNWGLVAQAGHFVADKQQVYARYEIVSAGDQPGDFDDYNTITIGYSFFPFVESNVNKFSLEFSYLFDAIDNTIVGPDTGVGFLPASEGDQWYLRFQAQFGF